MDHDRCQLVKVVIIRSVVSFQLDFVIFLTDATFCYIFSREINESNLILLYLYKVG